MILLPRVLIIDDDPQFQRVIVPFLGKDFTVNSATNGQDGIARVLSSHPELAVIGLKMPSFDALQTLHAFKTNPKLISTPIMFLSPKWIDSTIEKKGIKVDDHLVKDNALWNLLIPRLHAMLKKKQAAEQPAAEPLLAESVATAAADSSDQLVPLGTSLHANEY